MLRTWFLIVAAVAAIGFCASASAVEPIGVSVRAISCASNSTLFSEKGLCLVYDIKEGKKYLQVSIAVGVKVSAGTLLIGGDFKTLLEVVLTFPLGTSEKDAFAAAEKELQKQLLKDETKKVVVPVVGSYNKVSPILELIDCEDDRCRADAVLKLLYPKERK
jgi:hypothetical protein